MGGGGRTIDISIATEGSGMPTTRLKTKQSRINGAIWNFEKGPTKGAGANQFDGTF